MHAKYLLEVFGFVACEFIIFVLMCRDVRTRARATYAKEWSSWTM